MQETEMRKLFVAASGPGLPHCYLYVRNVGFFKTPGGGGFRAGIAGQADCYGHFRVRGQVLPAPVEIELKKYKEKLEPSQEVWRDRCHERNVPWLLLEEIRRDEGADAIPRWINETRAFLERHGYDATP